VIFQNSKRLPNSLEFHLSKEFKITQNAQVVTGLQFREVNPKIQKSPKIPPHPAFIFFFVNQTEVD
jgi:hypothetical protein